MIAENDSEDSRAGRGGDDRGEQPALRLTVGSPVRKAEDLNQVELSRKAEVERHVNELMQKFSEDEELKGAIDNFHKYICELSILKAAVKSNSLQECTMPLQPHIPSRFIRESWYEGLSELADTIIENIRESIEDNRSIAQFRRAQQQEPNFQAENHEERRSYSPEVRQRHLRY